MILLNVWSRNYLSRAGETAYMVVRTSSKLWNSVEVASGARLRLNVTAFACEVPRSDRITHENNAWRILWSSRLCHPEMPWHARRSRARAGDLARRLCRSPPRDKHDCHLTRTVWSS